MTPPGVVVVEVRGLPKPAGSKRVFLVGKERRPVVTDDCRTGRDWRARVQDAIAGVHHGAPLEGPLELCLYFQLPRPRTHLRRDGSPRPSAAAYPTTRPDVTKLTRAVEDADSGILWRDDAQVVTQTVTKRYGETVGVLIHCRPLRALETRRGRNHGASFPR